MSENAIDKFRRERGIDPSKARGVEISDLYDPEVVAEAEEEAAAAVEPEGPAEQNLVEFYNPFAGMFGDDAERPDATLIPGVKFPKLGTIATQDVGNFLTIPANIADERVRLGGPLISFDSGYEPADSEILGVVEKYKLRGDDRTLDKLLNATSPEDLEAQAKVFGRREAREEQIAVDNPGLVGLATRIGTNVLDPTFWVAGGYAGAALTARIANSTTKTGAAIRFASDGLTKGERFRIGAGTAVLVEAPLEIANTATDPSRDILLSAGFIALSPLVGGALSSVGRNRADEVAEAAEALDEAVAKGIMGTDGGAGGAAQSGPVPFTFPEEDLPGAPARANNFTVGTPLNFLARSADSLTRSLADKLSWNPNTRSVQGVTAAEAQRRIYQAQSVRLRAGRMAAKEYFKTKGFAPSTEQLDEFFRIVGQHIAGVRKSEDPAVLRAVEQYREGFAEGLAYVKDKDFVPGRARPTSGKPPETPPAPERPPEAPPEAPVVDRSEPIEEAVPDSPEPITASEEAPQVSDTNEPVVTEQAPVSDIAPTEAVNTYFGRQSFRTGSDTPAADAPPAAAAAADAGPAPEAFSQPQTALFDPNAAPTAPVAQAPEGKPNYFGRKSFRPVEAAVEPPVAAKAPEEPPAPVPVPQVENTVEGLTEGLFAAGADRETFEEILSRVERLKAGEVKSISANFVGGDPPKTKNKAIADIRGKFAKDRLDEGKAKQAPAPKAAQPAVPPQKVNSVNEKIAMVRGAAQQVIEPAKPAGPKPPTRVDLRTALKGYVDAAEAIAFAGPDVPLEIVEAAARARKVLQGFSLGSAEGVQARYVDALERLARALEDSPDGSPAGQLLATVVDDLDSGFGSRIRPQSEDGPLLARRPSPDDVAAQEQTLTQAADIYDKYLAEVQFTGKDKKPNATKDAAVAAVGLGAATGIAAWMLDASEETSAGLGLLGAGLGIALGKARGSARLRKWENETPGIALLLGPESKGADHKALKKAVQMEAAGTDRDVIWAETGWGRSPEGGWMFEADQPQGELVDDLLGPIKFGEAFKGERLMDLEPDLRKVVLQSRSLMTYLQMDKIDGLADPVKKLVAVREGLSRPQRLRVLLHELNHVLQQKRGYEFGTDAEFNARAKAENDRAQGLYDELTKLMNRPDMDPAEFVRLSDELRDAENGSSEFYQYMSSAAEAEARLVEARIGMSREKRRKTPPWKNFDVPEEDLWSGRGATLAASLGSDLRVFRNDDWWDDNVQSGVFADRTGLDGFQYAKLGDGDNSVYAWAEDYGDGEVIVNWDWGKNVDNNFDGDGTPQLYADNPDASPTEIARAFAFAQRAVERVLREGTHDVVTFEGAKKAPAGKTASGHERVQKFLMARGQTDGYQATVGSWKMRGKDGAEVTRSYFAFIREGLDVTEAWQGIRRGKVDIEIIPKKAQTPDGLAAKRTSEETPEAAPEPADDYRGLEEWRNIEEDPAYIPRRFNKPGWDKTFLGPAFRGNLNRLGNRIGDVIYRSNQTRMDTLGAAQPNPVSGLEMSQRVGRKYAETVNKLMNPARGQVNPYRKITADDREAAKEIVRDAMNDGETFGVDQEEAMEMLLDLIAPVKKKSAESARARPRIEMNLDAEQDADILDIFEWNVESLFTAYSRNISGYAGLLRAGFRSEAEIRGQIEKIRAQSDRDPKRQRRAEREAEMLELTLDAIVGRPPDDLLKNKHWTWFANQVRRLNFGNLMNNTGFLAISEVGAALTRVNIFRVIGMFPEFQRYYRQARAGDPAVRENLFYLADAVMGHGSAQVRSRVSQMADRVDGSNPSIEDAPQGVFDKIDRFTRKQANLTARLSGMTPMQEFLRMTIVTAEAQDWVKAARNGKPLYSPRRMAALGVDAPMWQRISGELRKWGDVQSPDSGKSVPNMALDQWEDAEALNVFLNAIDRNANRLVMEGDVGHQAFWLRNRPSAQLLFQFLNFPMNAFSKHAGFALNTFDARAAREMFAMSLGGALGYTARVLAQGGAQDTEEERNAYYAERLSGAEFGKAMFYYGGHYSLAPNAIDFGLFLGKTAGAPVEPLFTKTRATGLPGDPFTGNPTYSRFLSPKGALGKLTDPIKGTPFSEQDIHGLIKHFAPLGNHIALNAFLDQALEFLPDEEGSVEDQVQN